MLHTPDFNNRSVFKKLIESLRILAEQRGWLPKSVFLLFIYAVWISWGKLLTPYQGFLSICPIGDG